MALQVGTGRNIKYYHKDARLTGIDLSSQMIRQARTRATQSEVSCHVKALIVSDATNLQEIQNNSFDVVSASFLFCVLPNELQVLVNVFNPYDNWSITINPIDP